MVIVELIGSISLAIALISAIVLVIIHIKNKSNPLTTIDDHHLNNNINADIHQSSDILPFEEFNTKKELGIIDVIKNNMISSSSPIKYGIQWAISTNEDVRSEIIDSSLKNNFEFEQGDSLSFSEQSISVRNLIEKFENNLIRKTYEKEKNNQTDTDLTSIDTNFDNQTTKTELNQNQQKFSHHSSISNFDVTIPSNLSSSIDLEQFECTSTTSNLSEFLKN